jgi:hypothetical protein
MNLVSQEVNHIRYGAGVITEVTGDIIRVHFSEQIGIKSFLYPEAFDTFLKADNADISGFVLESLRVKREQASLELERKPKKRQEELDAIKWKQKIVRVKAKEKRL